MHHNDNALDHIVVVMFENRFARLYPNLGIR